MLKSVFLPILMCLLFSKFVQAAQQQDLVLDPSRSASSTRVTLPFLYHPVAPDAKYVFVFQGGAGLLTPETSENYMVIGTLKPCIGIVFHNSVNGHILGFHKHWSNRLEHINDFYHLLNVTDKSQMSVGIFSVATPTYDANYKIDHGGSTHLQELKRVKDWIVGAYGFERTQVKANLYTSPYKDGVLGTYEFAELSLLVDRNGKFFSICYWREDLMRRKGVSFTGLQILGPKDAAKFAREHPADVVAAEFEHKTLYEDLVITRSGGSRDYSNQWYQATEEMNRQELTRFQTGLGFRPEDRLPWESGRLRKEIAAGYRPHLPWDIVNPFNTVPFYLDAVSRDFLASRTLLLLPALLPEQLQLILAYLYF
jgi:hypothetical protein